ncbi:MAG: VCBS repeat-containing protein [Betaproteobacteria bacterium]|uniref:VCBS repeat-containing protein n=1 Tax=Candidatus Proximibacter danicus TaxID=2954365 RepID=A0A9D7K2V9_9PROT|nr:VCBS repeat-containing protein [Candidatus Proximibacter danicus]
MKIVSSGMQMASTHASTQHHEIQESLRMWAGERRPDFEGRGRPAAVRPVETVHISDAGRAAHGCDTGAVDECADEELDADPRLTLLRLLFHYLTGKDIEVFDARELEPAQPPPDLPQVPTTANAANAANARPAAGWGVEYDRHERYSETEQTRFAASGTVQTADGREISFKVELSMSRSYHEESDVRLRLGDAARQQKDPLVLNFAGNAAQLLDQRFSFDLDADGTAENINRLAAGSGFLVFDRNGDGKANDGSELFGTKSGDGFADLAQLDDDGNGWIDENDADWAALHVWTPDAEGGGALRTLQEAGVGAIALTRVATPFALKDDDNTTQGEIRSTGLYLQENGSVGTVQQVDLSV